MSAFGTGRWFFVTLIVADVLTAAFAAWSTTVDIQRGIFGPTSAAIAGLSLYALTWLPEACQEFRSEGARKS